MENREPSCTAGGNVSWYRPYGEECGGSSALKGVTTRAQARSRVRLSLTPQTVAHQAPLPMGFFRQEYWRGLPFPPPGDLPDPGIKSISPVSLLYLLSHQGSPRVTM